MDGRPLPGFYFDAEKKKYFKILPNHAAPDGSKYSKQAVKIEHEESKKRKRAAERLAAERRERVQRAVLLQHPLFGSIDIYREAGLRSAPAARGEAVVKAYAHGLRATSPVAGSPGSEFEEIICSFAHDPDNNALIMGFNGPPANGMLVSQSLQPGSHELTSLQGFSSHISAVAFSPSRTALATTLGDHSPATVCLMTRSDPALDHSTLDISILYRRRADVSVFTAAANPFLTNPSNNAFVVGATGGASVFGNPQVALGDARWDELYLETGSDVLATSWLDASTAILGLRNGGITLWDLRSEGSKRRLRHATAVSAVARANANQLVVAGLQDTLALYDLRMARAPHKRGSTEPVLNYAHDSGERLGLGMAVSEEMGLVATACGAGGLRLHALKTGEVVKELKKVGEGPVSCVRILENEGERRILAAAGPVVVELGW